MNDSFVSTVGEATARGEAATQTLLSGLLSAQNEVQALMEAEEPEWPSMRPNEAEGALRGARSGG